MLFHNLKKCNLHTKQRDLFTELINFKDIHLNRHLLVYMADKHNFIHLYLSNLQAKWTCNCDSCNSSFFRGQ